MGSYRGQTDGQRLCVSSVRASGRTMVPVVGEVDHLTAAQLQGELEAAVTGGARCVEVDFRRVDFCDCSGLNVLLEACVHAREAGVSFGVTGPVAPVVERLFQLTETGPSLLVRRAA